MVAWLGLSLFVVAAVLLDLRAGAAGAPSLKRAAAWSLVWTALGAAFGAVIYLLRDAEAAGAYLAGFVIEKSLSLDNLFVFAVVLSFFAVPAGQRRRVLVLGIAGAIILRAAFIVAGAAALDAFHGFTYVLGALLLATAWKVGRQGDGHLDPDKTAAMRVLRRVLPLATEHEGDRLLTRVDGRRMATPLLGALLLVAAFDVMFAVDSIPAIFAVTRDTYVVFAANAFSLLGMVSLYFLLDGLLRRFRHLNKGLAAILAFVGVKLLLADVWHPPVLLSLAVVLAVLLLAALASAVAERREEAGLSGAAPAAAGPPTAGGAGRGAPRPRG